MHRSLAWVAEATGGSLTGTDIDVDLAKTTTDSREVSEGALYFARVGDDSDGHQYLPQAVAAGAVAAVVERLCPDVPVPQVLVADSTLALGATAQAHLADLRLDSPLRVVAVTGSAGKTTTKDLLWQVLSASGPTVAPVRSFNNEVGCPLTILRTEPDTRFLVLEMGASGVGHIRYLTDIAPLDVAVELMVGRAHLGGYESAADLAATKQELVEGLRSGGVAVLNDDDAAVVAMAAAAPGQVAYFSAAGAEDALVRATHIAIEADGCPSFVLEAPDFRGRVRLRLAGVHQVSNALAAVAANFVLDCSTYRAVSAIESAKPISEHRMAVSSDLEVAVEGESAPISVTVVDDSYNANPDSMAAAFKSLSTLRHPGQRLVMVLGEMLELGAQSAQIHQEVGRGAAALQPEVVIGVGGATEALLDALPEPTRKYLVQGADEALVALKQTLEAGDLVLLKGSNGSGVWRVAEALVR